MLQMFLLNLGINLVTKYVSGTESKHDDKVLDLVKDGAKYLSAKDNNDVTVDLAESVFKAVMK
ncbi:hypothetical protein [Sulfurimonas sp.]|uniref:hypothetical protein n=1 Tax=Sulfurimonas sp. TaxID=2022749 RepID=UPI0035625C62